MGVPGLFSWVRRQFPEAIIPEEVWSKSSPAPVSSLFVDLNHILHACTHPEYPYEEPSSRDAMLEAILLYIEALLALVQPTDLQQRRGKRNFPFGCPSGAGLSLTVSQ